MASFTISGSPVVTVSPAVGPSQRILRGEYTTLSRVRTFLSLASADISDDTELRKIITWASRAIDRYTRRHFYPVRKSGDRVLTYDLPRKPDILRVDELDLLEVKGLSHVNGASEVDSSVYWLKCGDQWNMTPYDQIILNDSSGSVFNFSGTTQRAIHLDAVVGYHEDYDNAWIDSGGSLTAALASGINLASVSASAATNSWGLAPRFSEGQLLRLNSGSAEEYVYLRDTVNTSLVRLVRGINGTSQLSHAQGTAVYTWQPEQDIEFAATELSEFMYHKAKSPLTGRVQFAQTGIIEQPHIWPEQTIERLRRYKRSKIHAL